MKNKAVKFLLLVLLTCTSCSSIYRFTVDIQEPAPVTLPVSAQNVLILNNAVTQPDDQGIERTFDGKAIPANYPLSLDSMIWSATDEIANVLNDSHFFNKVAVYQDSLRTNAGDNWLSITGLSPEDQADFYNNDNFDALFVINRLLFSAREDVKRMQTYSSTELTGFVDLRADAVITCSMYVYGKDKPLTTFSIADSLFTKSVLSGDSTIFFKEVPEYMFNELSRNLGNMAAMRFVPTWKTVDRLFFTNYAARMQEATGYAANRQWATAESIWTTELGKTKKPVDKAKVAFNLAVANEMQDKLNPAWEWAQKAKEQLKDNNPKNAEEVEFINKYISELEQRIQNNRLLDYQWGKDSN